MIAASLLLTLVLFSAVPAQDMDSTFRQEIEKGQSALESKKYTLALEHLQRAEEMNKNDPTCLNLLGLASFQLMDYPKAREYLERSLSLNRKNPYTWTTLGHVFYMEEEFRDAINQYEKALSLDPGYEEALHYRNQLLSYGKSLAAWKKRHYLLFVICIAEIFGMSLLVRSLFKVKKGSSGEGATEASAPSE